MQTNPYQKLGAMAFSLKDAKYTVAKCTVGGTVLRDRLEAAGFFFDVPLSKIVADVIEPIHLEVAKERLEAAGEEGEPTPLTRRQRNTYERYLAGEFIKTLIPSLDVWKRFLERLGISETESFQEYDQCLSQIRYSRAWVLKRDKAHDASQD